MEMEIDRVHLFTELLGSVEAGNHDFFRVFSKTGLSIPTSAGAKANSKSLLLETALCCSRHPLRWCGPSFMPNNGMKELFRESYVR